MNEVILIESPRHLLLPKVGFTSVYFGYECNVSDEPLFWGEAFWRKPRTTIVGEMKLKVKFFKSFRYHKVKNEATTLQVNLTRRRAVSRRFSITSIHFNPSKTISIHLKATQKEVETTSKTIWRNEFRGRNKDSHCCIVKPLHSLFPISPKH